MSTTVVTICNGCNNEIKDLMITNHFELTELRADLIIKEDDPFPSESMIKESHFCSKKCLKEFVNKW